MSFFSPDMINQLLMQYGSIVLYFALCFGIIGIPMPDEVLMLTAGVLIGAGKLSPIAVILAALLGSATGITLTYLIGRSAGYRLVQRYGKWVHINEQSLHRAHHWFERFGKWTLFVGYFIPGVRHVIGLIAGTAKVEFPIFAMFTYTAALIFVSFFISMGFFFQGSWKALFSTIQFCQHMWYIFIGTLIFFIIIYIFWRYFRYRKLK